MSIFDRLSRLIRTNVNELVDQAENPEKLLNQILRDMRANIETARTQVVAMVVQEKELAAEIQQTRRLATEWGRKAQAAVDAGKDDLAREALRRKRDNEANLQLYEQQHRVQEQTVTKLKSQLQQLEAKYRSTLSQRDTLIARQRRAIASQKVATTLSTFSPLDPNAELERMERKIRGREAKAAAQVEMADESFDARFASLEDPEIERELQALKRRTTAPAWFADAAGPQDEAELTDLEEFDIDRELLALKANSTSEE